MSLLMVQIVDDTFVLQPDEAGLARANAGLTNACHFYRHRFQGGAKGPAAMAVGGPAHVLAACGVVDGIPVSPATELDVLGVVVDDALSLEPLLARVCGRLRDGARRLVAALTDRCLGLPLQSSQLPARVEAAAYHGSELLASHARGWQEVAVQLNRVYYDVAKTLLGLPRPRHSAQEATCAPSSRRA